MGYAKRKHIEHIERNKQRRQEDFSMTDYGPTDNQPLSVTSCTHCWHTDTTYTYTTYPPGTPRVCCHCGLRELYRPAPPPIPDGHGPYYPRQQPYSVTFTTNG